MEKPLGPMVAGLQNQRKTINMCLNRFVSYPSDPPEQRTALRIISDMSEFVRQGLIVDGDLS